MVKAKEKNEKLTSNYVVVRPMLTILFIEKSPLHSH